MIEVEALAAGYFTAEVRAEVVRSAVWYHCHLRGVHGFTGPAVPPVCDAIFPDSWPRAGGTPNRTQMNMRRNLDAFGAAGSSCEMQGFAVTRLEFASRVDLLAFAHLAGRPSLRDGGTAVWGVRPRGSTGKFSMRPGPADLHTDSTYHDRPEPFVLLFVERPAARGGESLVLHVDDLQTDLDDHQAADDTEALLRASIWRWKRPAAFGGGQTSGHAVLNGYGVRWRWDNLVMDGAGDRQFQAARCLVSLAKNSRAVRTLRLDRGDALLMDNRCVLHGRRGFEDWERQLYRIRFWELGA
ncbi:MAG: TauD/TfdA family dioxygenase [Mycolicibacterium sp.]|nr:TauD/TfdA family dioxygenase [Mycolicibacterium sp.]